MPIKVELTDEVQEFLRHECLGEELDAFRVCMQLVRRNPIAYSRPYFGRTNVPYVMRWFRFGGCHAYFEYHWTGDPQTEFIRVMKCRRKKPQSE